MRRSTFLLAGLLLGLSPRVHADVPHTIPFQAQVKTPAGKPVANSTVFTFSLYASATGGTALWTESQTLTPSAGLISTTLGGVTALSLSLDQPLWVGVKIGTDAEMTPRLPLASVPYALTIADGAVTTAKIADGSVTDAKIAGMAYSKLTGVPVSLPPSGAAGGDLAGTYPNPTIGTGKVENTRLANDAASLSKVSGGTMASASNKIGIGTTSPGKKLDIKVAGIADGLRVDGTSSYSPSIQLSIDGTYSGEFAAPTASGQYSTDAISGDFVIRSNAGKMYLQNGSGSSAIAITGNNVGIGTTSPATKLDVNGTAKVTGFQLGTAATAGQVLTTSAAGVGTWQALPASLPPSGAAGGDLTGAYPSPTIGTSKVTTSKLSDGAVTSAKIADGAVTSTQIADATIAATDLASSALSLAKVSGGAMTADGTGITIGTPTMSGGPFQVYGAGAVLDQSQSTSSRDSGATVANSCWQSFTAGANGTLAAVALYASSWGGGAWSGILYIRDGEGTTGTILSTQTVYGDGSYTPHYWALTNPIAVVSEHKYTVGLNPSGGTIKWRSVSTDAYAGGRSGDAGEDLWFQTYLAGATSSPILTTQPDTMNVGIGTASPDSKLTVAGVIHSTNGGMKFPDGTVQTTAAVALGGSAGGDLTGTYPNPTIAANAVSGAEIADGSVTSADIADATIASADLASDATSLAKVTGGIATAGAGTIGIGTSNVPAMGILQVAGTTGTIDQQQTSSNWDLYNFTDNWQSFTAGASGTLCAVGLCIGDYGGGDEWNATLSIYSGEGVSGTLLSTQTIHGDGVVTPRVFPLATPTAVTSGSQYSIYVRRLDQGLNWRRMTSNPYAGGRSSFQASDDQWFQTYLASAYRQSALMVEPMTLNVGIGVDDPSARLHVNGGAIITGSAGIGTTTPGYPISLADTLGDKIGLYGQTGNHFGFGVQSNLFQVYSATSAADIAFGYGQSSAMTETLRIKGTGNVGIGTSSPAKKLQIEGSGDVELGVKSTDSSGRLWTIQSSGGTGTNANLDGSFQIIDRTAGASRAYIGPTGNVGIGTTSPTYKLQVSGTLAASTLPSGDYNNVQWNPTTGQFWQDTSSRRYKENITPLVDDFDKLLLAEPKTYTRPGTPNRWEIGYIAEEIDGLGLSHLVMYDEQGRPDSVNYEKMVLYLNEIAKTQKAKIAAHETEIAVLKAQNADMQARLSRLEELMKAGGIPVR